ncbi:hypothetical protein B2A_10365, partial [mine drainage metagenome]
GRGDRKRLPAGLLLGPGRPDPRTPALLGGPSGDPPAAPGGGGRALPGPGAERGPLRSGPGGPARPGRTGGTMRRTLPPPPHDPRTLSRRTLRNGLPVVLQPAPPGSVTMAATWITEGGTARDPPGEEGMSMALAQLLLAGTRSLDKRTFARALDECAGSLGCEPSW